MSAFSPSCQRDRRPQRRFPYQWPQDHLGSRSRGTDGAADAAQGSLVPLSASPAVSGSGASGFSVSAGRSNGSRREWTWSADGGEQGQKRSRKGQKRGPARASAGEHLSVIQRQASQMTSSASVSPAGEFESVPDLRGGRKRDGAQSWSARWRWQWEKSRSEDGDRGNIGVNLVYS